MDTFVDDINNELGNDMGHLDTKSSEDSYKASKSSSIEGISNNVEISKFSEKLSTVNTLIPKGFDDLSLKIDSVESDYQFGEDNMYNESYFDDMNQLTSRTEGDHMSKMVVREDSETIKGVSQSAELTPESNQNTEKKHDIDSNVDEYDQDGFKLTHNLEDSGYSSNEDSDYNERASLTYESKSSENMSLKSKESFSISYSCPVSPKSGVNHERNGSEDLITPSNTEDLETYSSDEIELEGKDTLVSSGENSEESSLSASTVTYHSPDNGFSSLIEEDEENKEGYKSYEYNLYEPEMVGNKEAIDILSQMDDRNQNLMTVRQNSQNENIICYKRMPQISLLSRKGETKDLKNDNSSQECIVEESSVRQETNTTIVIDDNTNIKRKPKTKDIMVKFNNFFSSIMYGIIKSSAIFLLLFWLLSMVYGSLSLSSNEWLISEISYTNGDINGKSFSILGPYGLSRKDVAYLKDGAKLTLSRGLIYYYDLINKGYVDVGDDDDDQESEMGDKQKVKDEKEVRDRKKEEKEHKDEKQNDKKEGKDKKKEEKPKDDEKGAETEPGNMRGPEKKKAKDIINKTNEKLNIYSQCGHERRFVKKSCCFRDMCAVGNLNESDTSYFKSLYGPTVYDVHYSEFPNFEKGGKILRYTGIVSLVILLVVIALVSERLMTNKIDVTIRLAMRNLGNILWIVSIFLSITAFLLWRYYSGGSVCVDEFGKSKPCTYYYATYFYMVYMVSSLLGLTFYIVNCISVPPKVIIIN